MKGDGSIVEFSNEIDAVTFLLHSGASLQCQRLGCMCNMPQVESIAQFVFCDAQPCNNLASRYFGDKHFCLEHYSIMKDVITYYIDKTNLKVGTASTPAGEYFRLLRLANELDKV